jgi:signal transduction histidine kinase
MERGLHVVMTASAPDEIAILKAQIEELTQGLSQAKEQLEARTRDLTEALEQRTAMSEILRVISSSPTELQSALDALVTSAARFCDAEDVSIHRLEGDDLIVVAHCGPIPAMLTPAVRGTVIGRCVLERGTVHVQDLQGETEAFPEGSAIARKLGHRTIVAVPLLREGIPLGAILLRRTKVEPFSGKQIVLLQTFAEQAVIAIENTRLFEEVQARNRDLAALSEVGRAVNSTLDLKVVLKIIVDRAVNLSGADGAAIFYCREDVGTFELGETAGLDEAAVAKYRKLDSLATRTGLGEAVTDRVPLQIPDIADRPANPLRDAALEAGMRAALIVPLLGAEGPRGTLVLLRREPGNLPPVLVNLMQSFADQSTSALENARLFEEIAQRRLQQAQAELERVSRLTTMGELAASIAHEVNQPLAAILGNAETCLRWLARDKPDLDEARQAAERIVDDGHRAHDIIKSIRALARKSLPETTQLDINEAIREVLLLMRGELSRHGITLETSLLEGLEPVIGDRVQLQQVILNLIVNGIEAMTALVDQPRVLRVSSQIDGHGNVLIAVEDTGSGLDSTKMNRIFDAFFTTKPEGIGIGLSICRSIVEGRGGRLWASPNLPHGSVFRFTLPVLAKRASK